MDKRIPIKRWQVMKRVIDAQMSLSDACAELGLSYRQALRIKKTVIENGVRGCIHGNTGRHPANALSESVSSLIVELSRTSAAGLNDRRLADLLHREHNIAVSRETIRKIRRAHDIAPLKTVPAALSAPGGGRPREGRCMFWDGMLHQWFPSRGYACCLIAAIDDASGRCLAARFFPFEESAVYLWALQHVIKTHGIPRQIIQDCSALLKPSERSMSIEEQLRGAPDPTQIGTAVQALGIQPVFVTTRRQKRYFERVFEPLHISLIEAIGTHAIDDMKAGNCFLDEYFIEHYNHRNALLAGATDSAWRVPDKRLDLDRVCGFLYEAAPENNDVVRVGTVTIPLAKHLHTMRTARSRLEVRQLLDGSWRVYRGSDVIGHHTPTPLLEPLRKKTAAKRSTTRTAGYSWTYPSDCM
jgi:hypothetical protein